MHNFAVRPSSLFFTITLGKIADRQLQRSDLFLRGKIRQWNTCMSIILLILVLKHLWRKEVKAWIDQCLWTVIGRSRGGDTAINAKNTSSNNCKIYFYITDGIPPITNFCRPYQMSWKNLRMKPLYCHSYRAQEFYKHKWKIKSDDG